MSKKRKKSKSKKKQKTVPVEQIKSLSWREIYCSRWFLPLLGIFVLFILLALRLIIDLDIGFHLRGGQWMINNKSFHRYDVFTYTVNNNEYIAMYWLYQIILYAIYLLGSYSALTIFNTFLLGLTSYLIFLRIKISGVKIGYAVFILFLSLFALEIRFGVRPEIMTWIFLLIMLFILDQYFYRKKNYLHWLPIIQVLWVNFHGLFILGWVVLGAYLISTWTHKRHQTKLLFKWSIITVVATVFNPYLLKGVLFPFYLFTRLQGASIFKDLISEFASPWAKVTLENITSIPLYAYYFISILALLAIVITYRRRKVHEYLLALSFFYLSYAIVRNIPLFIIIACQIIAFSIQEISPRILPRIARYKIIQKTRAGLPYCFLIITILFSIRIMTNAYYTERGGGAFGIGLDKNMHPIETTNFLVEHNLRARIINDMNLGSWLIWGLPQPVFIDGRLEVMQEDFFQEYHESHFQGGLDRLIRKYRPKMILFDYVYQQTLKWHIQLKNMDDWRIIHLDKVAVVYAHDNYARQYKELDFLNMVASRGIDTTITDSQVWQILRQPSKPGFLRWLEGFYAHQYYPGGLSALAFFTYLNMEFRAAELLYLEVLKRTRYNLAHVYTNLGAIYYLSGEYKKALYCYERVLQEEPGHAIATQRINDLKYRFQK